MPANGNASLNNEGGQAAPKAAGPYEYNGVSYPALSDAVKAVGARAGTVYVTEDAFIRSNEIIEIPAGADITITSKGGLPFELQKRHTGLCLNCWAEADPGKHCFGWKRTMERRLLRAVVRAHRTGHCGIAAAYLCASPGGRAPRFGKPACFVKRVCHPKLYVNRAAEQYRYRPCSGRLVRK